MGSFAYTCCISKLPIESGDRVRYLLLTKNPYNDKPPCYAYDVWVPRTLPLPGKYDDYGGVDGIKDSPEKDLWLEGLKLDLVEREVGENTYHDVAVKRDMTFDSLQRVLLEGRLLVKTAGYYGLTKEVQVDRAMIREDVWQGILKLKSKEYRDGAVVNVGFEDFRVGINKVLALITDLNKNLNKKSNYLYHRDKFEHLMYQTLGGFIFKDPVPSVMGIFSHINLMMDNGKLTDEFVNTMVEFAFIDNFLQDCRHQWYPSAAVGPQFGEWEKHEQLLSVFAEVARSGIKRCNEE